MADNKLGYLLKNAGILTISNFASKIMIFLLIPLYTSILTTEEYGIYDLVFSMVQLLFPLLTLNITDAVMRFSMDKSRRIENVAFIGVRYLVCSIFPVGLFLIISRVGDMINSIHGYEGLIFLCFVSYFFNQFFIQFAKGLEKVGDMAIAGMIATIILIACNIIFLLGLQWGLVGFFAANTLSQGGSAIYIGIRIRIWKYVCGTKHDQKLQSEMLCYCLPLIFTTVGWWVNNTLDKYAVTFLCGVSANGILSVAYKIPSILNVLQGIFIQAWQISAIKEFGEKGTKEFYGIMFVYVNIIMCLGAAILILLSRPIASVLYARNFYAAWQYVPFLLIATMINSASGFIGPILSAAKDSKSMAKSAIGGSVVNLILNIALIYGMGIQGAAIATAVSSYVIYAIRKKAARDLMCVPKCWRIYSNWFCLITMAVLEINAVSYGSEIVILFLIMLLDYQELRRLFKTMKSVIMERVIQ